MELLSSDPVDLFSDDPIDLQSDALPERKNRVVTGGELPDMPGAQQQAVTRRLGIGGVVSESGDESL
jgi:hypothetical protein